MPPSLSRVVCHGLRIIMPDGVNAYTAYPFHLHAAKDLPYTVDQITRGGEEITFRAISCRKTVRAGLATCQNCLDIEKGGYLPGILTRFHSGIHESTPLMYLGGQALMEVVRRKDRQMLSLRLGKLNTAKKLQGVVKAMDTSKRLIVAISSGKVQHPDLLLRVGLRHNRGIRGLLGLYLKAAEGVYKPRNTSEVALMQGLLLWRLGGIRVAELAHRALGLPSMTTLRANSKMMPLLASYATPQLAEIIENIEACLSSGLREVLDALDGPIHQVLMVDEVAVEKRLRWDSRTNAFLGIGREDSSKVNMLFESEDDLDMVYQKLDDPSEETKIRYASEATVAAMGILTDNKRVYSARPIMISGTNKKENGEDHALLLALLLTAINQKLALEKAKHRVVSIASDGETRRGSALTILTLKHQLPPSSLIFPLLNILIFMNILVGDDDLTADKDFRHIFKRLRNLLLRLRGIIIFGQLITPGIIRKHLQDAGHSELHIHSVMHPDDKQDVNLAYQLLHDIWSLQPTTSTKPGYRAARDALRTLGKFIRYLVYPYVCVDFNLSEQLQHLAAAAFLALFLYREHGKEFLPTLLYTDIMIMIKNVFFCFAKAKVANPLAQFFIILLGTDRLEALFGIIRSMIGNDSGCDILQLVTRMTGSTHVSNILAQMPHWDRSPRRLRLPSIDRDGNSALLPENADHTSPAAWRGDLKVTHVNAQTCWLQGLSMLLTDVDIGVKLSQCYTAAVDHNKTVKIDIFQPLGTYLLSKTHPSALDPEDNECDDNGSTTTLTLVTASQSKSLSLPPVNRVNGAGFLRDIEEAVDEQDETPTKFEHRVAFQGKMMNKNRALRLASKFRNTPGSLDRLKKYQGVDRFNTFVESPSQPAVLVDDGSYLIINDLVASVVRCEDCLFLCLGEVTSIHVESRLKSSLPTTMLTEKSVSVTFQLLFLVAATIDDDPSQRNDWRTRRDLQPPQVRVPGRLVQQLNPPTPLDLDGKSFYLLESSILLAVAADFHGILTLQDSHSIQTVRRSPGFPYRTPGGK
ncbi:hypothetical protein C8J56DRAFT_799841 [Mycena floridula]|nr:hypothetical protein C8J56DRAFT_799841 [Mycena floridula]